MTAHKYSGGIIGNCSYIAHIDSNAAIKWLCWPKFDSSFIFGSLIDEEKGGQFTIAFSEQNHVTKQYYIDNTNVLCTEFLGSEGKFRVTDFAPRFTQYDRNYRPLMLVRKIEPIHGTPVVNVVCMPAVENGRAFSSYSIGSNHIRYNDFDEQVRLTTNIPLNAIIDNKSFILTETKYLVLTYGIPLEAGLENTVEDFLKKTIHYWRAWIKGTYIPHFHQRNIIRSALVLKIHQYEQTGAIIASSTTSLPEYPGTGRNWDYRYCWLRDSYYTLSAFNQLGHFDELEKYFQYIANITIQERDRLQPLYTVEGDGTIKEKILSHLQGYKGNGPVRIGNAAYTHNQNDVYGQVLVSLLPLYIDQRFIGRERSDIMGVIRNLLRMIEHTMEEPDAGIWEFRELRQVHGYTLLFHWAGSCAAEKIISTSGNEELIAMARQIKELASTMMEKCYDAQRKVYTQAINSKHLDASMLQLITLGYLDPSSDKARQHLLAMEKELKTEEGLFFRYKHHDDFGAPESTFLICSFWYVEALATVGRLDEAMQLFERLNQFTNDLGLYSEDIDAKDGSQWGNFPQTYSHVGQINAAFRIAQKLSQPIFL